MPPPQSEAGQHLNYTRVVFGNRSVENESILFLVMGIFIFGFVAMAMLALKLRDKF